MPIQNRDGALFMATGIDNSGLNRGFADAENRIDQFGKNAEKMGEALSKSLDISKQIEIQKKVIADLEKEYDKASKSLEAMSGQYASNHIFSDREIAELTQQYNTAKKLIDESKSSLDREKKSLEDLEKEYQKATKEQEKLAQQQQAAANKQITTLQQIKKVTEEMRSLRGTDGVVAPENIQRYDELKKKLSELGTSYRIVQQEQKALTTAGNAHITGLIQGITALSGIFAAGQGIASFFVKNNEKLAEVQTKLQAAMSITMGLQQVSNTLHATSNFRINTLTKATQLWSTANYTLGKSFIKMGVSANVAKIASAGLLGAGIGALVVGIGILIGKYKEWNKQQEETKRLNKIVTNSLKEASLEAEKAAKKEISSLELLYKASQNDTKSKEERLKAAKELQKLYPAYFANMSKEEILAGKAADAYDRLSKSIIASARARAAQDKIVENESKALDIEAERNELIDKKLKKEGAIDLIEGNLKKGEFRSSSSAATQSDFIKKEKHEIEKLNKSIWEKTKEIGKYNEANQKLVEKININDLFFDGRDFEKGTKGYWQKIREEQQREMDSALPNSDIFNKAKKARDEAAKELEKWDKTNFKSEESAAEKTFKQAQNVADQQGKIIELQIKQTLESKRRQEDLENQQTQSYIDTLADNNEKIRYQKELDNYLEIQAIERAKEDYIRAYVQAEKEKFDAQEELKAKKNSKYVKKQFDSSGVPVDASSYDTIIRNTRDSQFNKRLESEKIAWNEHLIQFGTYQEKRKAIIEKYEKEIDLALTKGDAATLEKQKQNQLDELDNSVRNSTTLMGQLFADASRKSVNEMQAIIEKADLLLQYLEAVKDEQGNATIGGKNVSKNDILGLGITENTLNNLSQSTQEVESLRNAIKQLKGELGGKSAFKLFEIQIKDAINLINGGKLSQGISGIGSAVSQFSPAVSQFGQDLGNILGNDDLGNKISGIADAIGGLGQTAQGVGQIMSGDIIGGTMAVVSGISKVVDALDGLFGADYSKFNAMKEQYDSMNEVWDQLIDKKKEYLAMAYGEEAKRVGKEAEDLVNKSIESYRLLGKEYLNSGTSAGSHSKGVRQRERINSEGWAELQQWAKNNDISESLYGSVAGGRMTGLFDLTAAQLEKLKEDAPTFWAKLSDETKEYLDNIIDGAAKIEDINKSIKEQLTQVSFDSVFDDFIDTLMDMDSSSKDFADNFANYLQKAILSSLVADKYREKLQAWYDNFAKANEEDGIDAKEYADLQAEYNKIVEDALKERDALKDLLNWTGSDSSSSQSPSKGGYETMSQDTATALEGRFTAIQMSMINIEGYILSLLNIHTDSNSTLKAFASNFQEIRNIVLDMMYNIQDINKNTKELYEINSEIKGMSRKLDSL